MLDSETKLLPRVSVKIDITAGRPLTRKVGNNFKLQSECVGE